MWARAMDWWTVNATHGLPEHFGGGIVSLKYAYPLLDGAWAMLAAVWQYG